jgi:hypothetical protein
MREECIYVLNLRLPHCSQKSEIRRLFFFLFIILEIGFFEIGFRAGRAS